MYSSAHFKKFWVKSIVACVINSKYSTITTIRPTLMKLFIRHVVFFSVLYFVLFPPQAHAYLDPGTGSYILQIVAAVLFASLFLIKTWWVHIKHFFNKLSGKDKKSEKDSKNRDH